MQLKGIHHVSAHTAYFADNFGSYTNVLDLIKVPKPHRLVHWQPYGSMFYRKVQSPFKSMNKLSYKMYVKYNPSNIINRIGMVKFIPVLK